MNFISYVSTRGGKTELQALWFHARAYAGAGVHTCNGPTLAEEVLEHPLGFGCESNLGSIQQELESILKGGSLNIFSVPYNPSLTICYWTLGNRIPTERETESEIFCLNHRIAILYSITAILPCLTC